MSAMSEITNEELESQLAEVLPAREEMLVGFVLGEVGSILDSTCSVTTTTILGKTIVVVVC